MPETIIQAIPTLVSLIFAVNFVVTGTWQSASTAIISVVCQSACSILIKSKGGNAELAALKSKVESLTSEVKKHGLRLGYK